METESAANAVSAVLPPDTPSRRLFGELKPGDRIEATHEVKVGLKRWTAKTVGTVERCERRLHGLHFNRHLDDKVYSDLIVLRRDTGELSTVTIDEFTVLRRI